jgi:hypothetical protein
MVVKALFLLGIVLAVAAAFVGGNILPWIVGGTGILTGFAAWKFARSGILICAIVLVVCLSAIREQPFNPSWLTDIVFFVRVFVAHVGLAGGVLAIFAPQGHIEAAP